MEEFLSLAFAYERENTPSLEGFLHWIERGGAEIKRDMEQGRGEIDSCAVPEQQPVSRLWPARRELIDCRVAVGGPLRARAFAAILACEAAARRLKGSRHKP